MLKVRPQKQKGHEMTMRDPDYWKRLGWTNVPQDATRTLTEAEAEAERQRQKQQWTTTRDSVEVNLGASLHDEISFYVSRIFKKNP